MMQRMTILLMLPIWFLDRLGVDASRLRVLFVLREVLYIRYLKQGLAKKSRHIMFTEKQLVEFGNYLLSTYGVMVHSTDGKNIPVYQRQVSDADLCNWKDTQESSAVTNSKFSIGDKVKIFLMPEGVSEFPGFTAYILAVHNYVGKIKYDVEIKFAGDFSTRIYNVDEVLVSA